MKILCVFGHNAYGDPGRGEGYEHANFLPALRALGHEIALFESFDRRGHKDFADLNRSLLNEVQSFGPDVMFCVLMGYEVWTETLDLIRAVSPVQVINWGTDDSWKYESFSRHLGPHVDLWATTSRKAALRATEEGHDNFWLTQWAASASLCAEPLAASACRFDVSFVGSAYGNRMRWIESLRERGIEVNCFGYGWPAGPVPMQEIPRIYRDSVLSLNFGDSGLHFKGLRPYRSRQIKARVFEVPGAGGCLLSENAEGLSDCLRPGSEILLFNKPDDLAATIRYYLERPTERDAIAQAGHARVRHEHTYELRFAMLLKELDRAAVASKRKPSVGWPEVFSRFERLGAEHRCRGVLQLLRGCLTGTARLLWGARRGPRAARRLVYELSWRLAGSRTYSAQGLPGRMFYAES